MDHLARLRQKCFFATMLVGGVAGLLETHWAHQGLLFNFFCGLIVVTLAGFLGSFVGFFFKNTLRHLRGSREFAGEYNDGIMLGSLFGAIIGIVIQVIFGSESHTALGAGIGSAIGGFLGTLPDETILAYVLTAMYNNDEELLDIPKTCQSETL